MSLLDVEGDFGLSMLQLSTNSLVASPGSALMALGLVFLGAAGNTKEQLRNAVGKGFTDQQITDHYSCLSNSLIQTFTGVQTNVANRMYIKKGFTVKPTYLNLIKQKYDAEAETLDFSNGAASAKVVNGFVNETTKGKISDLVTPATFTDAVALLINAIYMKGEWERQFNKTFTTQGDFNVNANTKKQVKYMTKESEKQSLFFEDDTVQILTLPYEDTAFAFTMFLPKVEFGLAAFKSKLTGAKLQTLLKSTHNTTVTIKVPKMTIKSEIDLKPILVSLGVSDLFSNIADLSGIADNIKVSSAKQKALIETDEEGTVAAAATVIEIVPTSIFYPPEFIADHPFLFTVTFKGHILFLGQFYG